MLQVYIDGKHKVSSPDRAVANSAIFANWLEVLTPRDVGVCDFLHWKQTLPFNDRFEANVDAEVAAYFCTTPWPESRDDVARARRQAAHNLR